MSDPNYSGNYPGWPVLAGGTQPPQRPSPSNRLILVVGAVIVATIIGAALLVVLTRSDGTTPAPFGGTGNAAPVPGTFEGTWSGTIAGPYGIFTTWPLKITIPGEGQQGQFSTPTLSCSGTVTIVGVNPDSILLELTTEENPARRCTQRSSITLTPRPDGKVDAAWQDMVDRYNTGTGVLSR